MTSRQCPSEEPESAPKSARKLGLGSSLQETLRESGEGPYRGSDDLLRRADESMNRYIPVPFMALVYLLDAVGGSMTWTQHDIVGFDYSKYEIIASSDESLVRRWTLKLEERK